MRFFAKLNWIAKVLALQTALLFPVLAHADLSEEDFSDSYLAPSKAHRFFRSNFAFSNPADENKKVFDWVDQVLIEKLGRKGAPPDYGKALSLWIDRRDTLRGKISSDTEQMTGLIDDELQKLGVSHFNLSLMKTKASPGPSGPEASESARIPYFKTVEYKGKKAIYLKIPSFDGGEFSNGDYRKEVVTQAFQEAKAYGLIFVDVKDNPGGNPDDFLSQLLTPGTVTLQCRGIDDNAERLKAEGLLVEERLHKCNENVLTEVAICPLIPESSLLSYIRHGLFHPFEESLGDQLDGFLKELQKCKYLTTFQRFESSFSLLDKWTGHWMKSLLKPNAQELRKFAENQKAKLRDLYQEKILPDFHGELGIPDSKGLEVTTGSTTSQACFEENLERARSEIHMKEVERLKLRKIYDLKSYELVEAARSIINGSEANQYLHLSQEVSDTKAKYVSSVQEGEQRLALLGAVFQKHRKLLNDWRQATVAGYSQIVRAGIRERINQPGLCRERTHGRVDDPFHEKVCFLVNKGTRCAAEIAVLAPLEYQELRRIGQTEHQVYLGELFPKAVIAIGGETACEAQLLKKAFRSGPTGSFLLTYPGGQVETPVFERRVEGEGVKAKSVPQDQKLPGELSSEIIEGFEWAFGGT